jgi:membrane-associated phospholipid phosphatase
LLSPLDRTEAQNLPSEGFVSRPAMSATPAAAQSSDREQLASPGALSELGPQDWMVLGYVTVLLVAVLQGERGATFGKNLTAVVTLAIVGVAGILLARTGMLREGWPKGVLYRVAIYGPVQISYFFFRDLLPAINPGALDQKLHTLDLQLFGVEPAIALDRVVTSTNTEWFAFFYFGYFFVLAVHVVPILFLSRSQRVLGEFAFGMVFIFCVGHTVYMLVPGFGPYRAMANEFHTALPHGLWLDLVMDTVKSGGAQKDIFPSLHTAAPTFIALFSFRHRHRVPYRFTWPITAFFALNIMVATMFLRWHYLVDVVVGLALATVAAVIVGPLVERDLRRRALHKHSTLWPTW